MKVAIVTPAIRDSGRLFGAERLFVSLVDAFQRRYNADWVEVTVSEATWEGVLTSYLDCYDLDLSAYDLVISTKNPTFAVRHPNHVCWLLHQIRVFYDRFDAEYGKLDRAQLAEKQEQRKTIEALDNLAFRGVQRIFSIGYETSRRLKQYNGFDSEVLYPPVHSRGHYCAGQEYFLMPGRLHRWKRVDLTLRAMRSVSANIPLLIPGIGEDEEYFRKIAGDDPRIKFLGFVSDEDLRDLYANALAVLFVPRDEDFGYVAVEAMLSHKPVIVCRDSGEPVRLVKNGRSGFVVSPDPVEIAAAMNILAGEPELAKSMGDAGFRDAPSQSWDDVVYHLMMAGAAGLGRRDSTSASAPIEQSRIKMLVADNQVLDPPVGGGRIRIYELYRHVAELGFDVTYVGAYDWPGPVYRDQMLAPYFRECVTPLTQPHFAEDAKYRAATGGKTTIDVTIPKLMHLSPRFRRMASEFGQDASIVVISHPWVHDHVPRRPEQKLIYDAHNCEFVVKEQILDDSHAGRRLVGEVKGLEQRLCREADLIFVCSDEDAKKFEQVYGISGQKMVVVPNGVDETQIKPASDNERRRARQFFGVEENQPLLIFIGSGYWPNTEAARYMVTEVAPRVPACTIAIAGSVKDSYESSQGPTPPANVRFLGVIDASSRALLYQAADIALNPMFSGSGTNLKMLDYFAAGLPVVSTTAGARGLDLLDGDCIVCDATEFVEQTQRLLGDENLRRNMARRARLIAEEKYAWSRIAATAVTAINKLLTVEPVCV
jgi:glycosyltransferase involved in cell wall biosynthesis